MTKFYSKDDPAIRQLADRHKLAVKVIESFLNEGFSYYFLAYELTGEVIKLCENMDKERVKELLSEDIKNNYSEIREIINTRLWDHIHKNIVDLIKKEDEKWMIYALFFKTLKDIKLKCYEED